MWYVNGELCHHGIQGQKWGVRRYQNEDGSYTNAGKRRYGSEDGDRRSNSGNSSRRSDNYGGRSRSQNNYSQQPSREYASEGEEFMKSLGRTFALATVNSLGNSFGNMLGQLPGAIANAKINDYYGKQKDARNYEYQRMLNNQKAQNDADKMKAEQVWKEQQTRNQWAHDASGDVGKGLWEEIYREKRKKG